LRAGVTIPDLNESGIFPSAKIWLKIEDKIGVITSLECFRCSATFEYCLLDKLKLKSNSPLQFGFTSSLCPIMAGLLISEARYEKKLDKENFYITFLDVKSAFDVVMVFLSSRQVVFLQDE
jgi:homoserine kinase